MNANESVLSRLERRKLLGRGETVVAIGGLSAAIILLGMLAGVAWWTGARDAETRHAAQVEQVRALSNLMGSAAESMLAGDNLSSLRRLAVETRQQNRLETCRLVLLDGAVLVDANPGAITQATMPNPWPRGPVDGVIADAAPAEPGSIIERRPVLVPGRGSAMLEIIAKPADSIAAISWDATAVIGAFGAAGLSALLLVYRQLRSRTATLGKIRECLLAARDDSNGAPRQALAIGNEDGPEAEAWNALLGESEKLRKKDVAARVQDSLGQRRSNSSLLEHACDALTVGMVTVDSAGIVKHANGAAAALLQVKRADMVGAQLEKFLQSDEVKALLSAILAGSGQRKTIEVSNPGGEGKSSGILRVHVRPMRRAEDAGGALLTFEDVTQQRIADEARNSFVAQATHELRMPLTNMRLCLEDALDDTNIDPAMQREHFNLLNRETRRLERMVGEMLSVAEIEAGSLRLKTDDVRVDRMFEELAAEFKQTAAEKQLGLSFDLPPKYPVVLGDRDKLMMALHNLLGNAMKYTPAGGKVTVAVKSDASKLMVDITDTGIGIGPEDQQKLFQKFYRASDPRVGKITGTGLGLALTREIARLHGGDVTIQSELDKGSTFTLSVPVCAAGGETQKQSNQTSAAQTNTAKAA
jgi:PAS domain S-box-containing protein